MSGNFLSSSKGVKDPLDFPEVRCDLPGDTSAKMGQGWGSLVSCRLWGRTESGMTEATQQQQQQHSFIAAKQVKCSFM